MELGLRGKNILVTGAAKGIGRGLALAVASEGANVVVHYNHSEEEARLTVNEIQQLGGKVLVVQGDISSLSDVNRMKMDISERLGQLDGIVNNVGGVQSKRFFQYTPEEWHQDINVCFYGVLNLVHAFVPDMMDNMNGKFINIVGDSARTGDKTLILSAAARAGSIGFLKSLAHEVGPFNVQCNTVALGKIDNESQEIDPVLMDKILKRYPLRRLGSIEDVSGVVLFLLSRWSDWITGQTIPVNGGFSMMS